MDRDRVHSGQEASIPTGGPSTVVVSVVPSEGLLMSMALRYDHGLGCPGYYDHPLMGKPGDHARRLASTITTMRQLYEEVVGTGFYSSAREAAYLAMRQAAISTTAQVGIRAADEPLPPTTDAAAESDGGKR